MWGMAKYVALLAVLPTAYGGFTYCQSTHSGPFAHFQAKYPNMSGAALVNAANEEILKFAVDSSNPLEVKKFMEGAGFDVEIFTGDDLIRQMVSKDKSSKYRFSYRYGIFYKTHAWVFSFTVDDNNLIDPRNPFVVCTACP